MASPARKSLREQLGDMRARYEMAQEAFTYAPPTRGGQARPAPGLLLDSNFLPFLDAGE